jgi:hypothetical protein
VQLAGQYIEAAIQVIEASEAGIPVKVSAVKAIQKLVHPSSTRERRTDVHCIHSFCLSADDAALTPFMPRVAKDLGPFLLLTSEDTLCLVLDTLSVVLEADGANWMTPDLANSLVLAALEVWSKNNKGPFHAVHVEIKYLTTLVADPIFISVLTDILLNLAKAQAEGVYETVVQQALPILSNAIGVATASECWVAGSAIEMVTSLVQGSPDGRLAEGFFALLAPQLFACLSVAEDRDVLQVCLARGLVWL